MKRHKQNSSIIYINFAPYENTGNIRDYLLDSYDTTAIYLFNFHRLTKLDQPSKLTIYKGHRAIYHTRLFQTPTIPSLAWVSLPVRSLVIFAQIIFHTLRLRCIGYIFDDYFTVNAFIAWTGIILKKCRLIKRTIFWVWDYYPPIHKSKMVMFMRWMYWLFDIPATTLSDKTLYLTQRMIDVRKKHSIISSTQKHYLIPIGTNPIHSKTRRNKYSFVFLGVLKQSHGLDLFFESLPYLKHISHLISLHIIGGGPDEQHYRALASKVNIPVYFHGYLSNDNKVDKLLSTYGIGIATYIPHASNVSYWGDPSKIKRYLSAGIPTITTPVYEFSKIVKDTHCGVVIPYAPKDFAKAAKNILSHYTTFRKASLETSQKFLYRHVYRAMFD